MHIHLHTTAYILGWSEKLNLRILLKNRGWVGLPPVPRIARDIPESSPFVPRPGRPGREPVPGR